MRVTTVNKRMRLLLSGDAAVGKTYQMFTIVKWVLMNTDKRIYYMDCDTGAVRFYAKLLEDPDITPDMLSRFAYYQTPNWIELRNAYRDIRLEWQDGDVAFVDRVDMAWDFIQHYYNSMVLQVGEEELDEHYLNTRMQKRAKTGDKKDMAPDKEIGGTDWDSVKNAYNSVVYDLFNGPTPSRMGIHVCMSALAESRDHAYNPSGKPDARVLDKFAAVVRGERNITSLPDTHIFLKRSPLGRIASTVKDRERPEFADVQLDSTTGFVEFYKNKVGHDLIA